MALYAIGDTHLSLGADKPMDVFGGGWSGYVDKLRAGFAEIGPEDTVVLCGDLSWGMSLEQAREDFAFLDALPGRKILLKGNHDYWWSTVSKMKNFFTEKGLTTLDFLHNNCALYGDYALCGTRGWFFEEDQKPHNAKVLNREVGRLETSLGGGGTVHLLLPSLSAAVSGLRVPGDPAAAEGVRREAVLLRPSARRFPPPGHRGNVGWNGVFAGVGGLFLVLYKIALIINEC